MDKNTITVTSPLLPNLEDFEQMLREIWDSKWVTNNGQFHNQLEKALCEYLKVPYISLFTNGTLPLLTALQALRITGEVITTPYSFVATTHAIWWNGCKPVFVDIDPSNCGMDPDKIEAAITPKTTAIMPVHCYGKPCDMVRIQEIADKYGLKVIYDAAHAFGVEITSPTPDPSPVGRGESPRPLSPSDSSSPLPGGPRGATSPLPGGPMGATSPLLGGSRGATSPLLGGPRGAYRMTAEPADYAFLKEHARKMRREPTEAENVLWKYLRNDLLGVKFRRQHPILEFIVDFINFDANLVIEVDGGYHNDPDQQRADMIRDRILQDNGFQILRFTNEEVLFGTDATIDRIRMVIESTLLREPRGATSPLPGGPKGASSPLLGGPRGASSPLPGGLRGASVLLAGNMSTLSFHATKVFNTLEGGALVMHDEQTKKRIDYLKNFGFENETEVVAPGINSKMDEVRAAYGLLNLQHVDEAIEKRHQVAIKYREALRNVKGIRFFDDMPGVRHNYSYFPIFVNADEYGMTRDALYFKMKEHNVLGRRYFYPLISSFSTYRGLPSASPENLPVANRIANEVICLPMHHGLTSDDISRVLELIVK